MVRILVYLWAHFSPTQLIAQLWGSYFAFNGDSLILEIPTSNHLRFFLSLFLGLGLRHTNAF